MLIASLSLVAFPFMTGFYSKDFILESAYAQFYFSSTVVYLIATIGAMFTTLYSVKVLYLTFITNPNGPLVNYKQAHEGDVFMSLPLILLAIFSIFFGYITKDLFIGLASGFFSDNSLFIHPSHEIMLHTEFAVPTLVKLLPLVLTISLSAISIVFSEYLPKILIYFKASTLGYNIFSFFNLRFLIELFYNKYITALILKLGGQTTKVLDKGSVELIGPFGLEKGLLNLSSALSALDTGVITSYALYILIGLIFYILIPYLSLSDSSLLLLILFALFILNNVKKYTNIGSRLHRKTDKNNNSKYLPLQSSLLGKHVLLYKLAFGAAYIGISFGLPVLTNIFVYAMTGDMTGDPPLPNFNGELQNIITELARVLSQLSGFINQFHNFVNETGINVVTDAQGTIGIDVLETLDDSVALQYANRINVLDGLIHNHVHTIEHLLETASGLEEQIQESNSNYLSQLSQYRDRLTQLIQSYAHVNN